MARIPNVLKETCVNWCELTVDNTVTVYQRKNGRWSIIDTFELTNDDTTELAKPCIPEEIADQAFIGYLYPREQLAPIYMRPNHSRMVNGVKMSNHDYYTYLLRDG
jgi:hypothetical protein